MIPVKNIYYMLAYAFSALRSKGYASIAAEEFDNAEDLLEAILTKGINQQVKRGLKRDYVSTREDTRSPKGKIDVSSSIKMNSQIKGRLHCEFDEFTENNYLNQILKTASNKLLRSKISKDRSKALKRALSYLSAGDLLDERKIAWNHRYDRNSRTYQMLVSVSHLVIRGLIQTENAGNLKIEVFDEEVMSRLYEKFVLEYFRTEHGKELSATAPFIPWALDDDYDNLLPAMRTDITLERRELDSKNILIIDTKYYTHLLQTRFSRHSIHSENLYQIFAYVKNMEAGLAAQEIEHRISGMLLYAKTDESISLDESYKMSGNQIAVRTLDLNQPFELIRQQLDSIVKTI